MIPIKKKKKKKADSQIIIDPSILRHKPDKTCLIFQMQIATYQEFKYTCQRL